VNRETHRSEGGEKKKRSDESKKKKRGRWKNKECGNHTSLRTIELAPLLYALKKKKSERACQKEKKLRVARETEKKKIKGSRRGRKGGE